MGGRGGGRGGFINGGSREGRVIVQDRFMSGLSRCFGEPDTGPITNCDTLIAEPYPNCCTVQCDWSTHLPRKGRVSDAGHSGAQPQCYAIQAPRPCIHRCRASLLSVPLRGLNPPRAFAVRGLPPPRPPAPSWGAPAPQTPGWGAAAAPSGGAAALQLRSWGAGGSMIEAITLAPGGSISGPRRRGYALGRPDLKIQRALQFLCEALSVASLCFWAPGPKTQGIVGF